jgi:hypothetical protein
VKYVTQSIASIHSGCSRLMFNNVSTCMTKQQIKLRMPTNGNESPSAISTLDQDEDKPFSAQLEPPAVACQP